MACRPCPIDIKIRNLYKTLTILKVHENLISFNCNEYVKAVKRSLHIFFWLYNTLIGI